MYTTLTKQVSLFLISDDMFKTFQQVATETAIYPDLKSESPMHTKSRAGLVFNVWCLLLEDRYKIFMDYEKMMMYSSTFYCLNLLRNAKNVQQFMKHYHDEQTTFIFAYYLTGELVDLVQSTLQQNEPNVYNKYEYDDYFALYEKEQQANEVNYALYEEQRIISSIFSNSYHTTETFQACVERGIKKTSLHLLRLQKKFPST